MQKMLGFFISAIAIPGLLLVTVSGCEQMHQIGEEARALGQDFSDHGTRMAHVVRGTHSAELESEERAYGGPRFCYRTQSDILCYTDPLPGQDQRLVGYQAGETTGLNPPVLLQPLPSRAVEAPPSTSEVPVENTKAEAPQTVASTPFTAPQRPVPLMP